MTYRNDREAYILANVYGLLPPQLGNCVRARNVYSGKYEPDHNEGAETRTITLASYKDGSNLLVKYAPEELIPPE
jgi:hypothetical protein